ncbi:hypothetical protein KW850_20010 [Bacillus sp. sid0103]|uniref:hypothetical protein n=1 Tax=Bacillus sp. sid0103 TaxID=2856337 RepID=UPI001C478F9A|nr:hypothetical protein [Bacillus sp. sid0103]MBV7507530.1 hypothetical protein [Bacillus sp. sid0103]
MESLLVMIVIGIISVLFGKSKNKQGKPKSKPFSKATFEEIRTQVKKQLSYVEDKKSSQIKPEHKTNVIRNNLENLEQEYVQLKQQLEVNRNGITMAQQKTDNIRVKQFQEDENHFSFNPDEKMLLNGLIWSEILGEPRSKKPYRPRNS